MLLDNGAKIEVISLYSGKLFIESEFQRLLDEQHVNRIVKAFDPKAVRMPTLHREVDARLSILDGQHTIAALKLVLGPDGEPLYRHYKCEVFSGLTLEDKADLFYMRNTGKKGMSGWTRFKAALVAGKAEQIAVKRIVEKTGLKLGINAEPHPDFNNPDVLLAIYKKKYEPHFIHLIKTLRTCFVMSDRDPHLEEDVKRTEFIRGLSVFLGNHHLEEAIVKRKLRQKGTNGALILRKAVEKAGECRRVRSLEKYIVLGLCGVCDVPPPLTLTTAA